MESFDIRSLLRFEPPRYLCPKCCALWLEEPPLSLSTGRSCPVCGVSFQLDERTVFPLRDLQTFLQSEGLVIQFEDVIAHSRVLAGIADRLRTSLNQIGTPNPNPKPAVNYPPLRALFTALLHAQQFVHFVTLGLSHMILGPLKMCGLRVPVRGVVSGAADELMKELTVHTDESPRLDVKATQKGDFDAPHQKLVIIDGLLAFKGSTNLTLTGWRNAALGLDHIELVTDVKEVADLNNRYFSPIWASYNDERVINILPF